MDSLDDDFVADAGPEFDPRLSPEPPDIELVDPELADELDIGWTESQIRDLLFTQGSATNFFFRLDPEDDTWKHTEDDLKAIAPPLTRILNRYDATRAAAAAGDEIALGTALFNYGARNVTKRRRLIRQLNVQVPVTGVAAPEGTGPPIQPDPDVFDPGFDVNAPPALVPKGRR
jgi:ABC-type Fe3+ transport system substrate-binding protein